jgi:capsular polysaccharide export protein
MSKFSKFRKNPKAYFKDAFYNRFSNLEMRHIVKKSCQNPAPTALLLGFADWKVWMKNTLPDKNVVFLGHSPVMPKKTLNVISKFKPKTEVYGWSYKWPKKARDIAIQKGFSFVYVEDGFIRSVGLGANKSKPMSLVFDTRGMHFDRHKVTDLDIILNTTQFTQEQLDLAEKVSTSLKEGLSKYITVDKKTDLKKTLGITDDKTVILVLGQVEDDMSIAYGMEKFMTGNEFVTKIALENPEAHILYRPHPESISYTKKHYSKPEDVSHLCHIVPQTWSLQETFKAADEAHTMTSLSGLEAAINGLKVHTYGMPFYAGWGFTTDHGLSDVLNKRTRHRTLLEVVAGAYVVYPKYYNPITSEEITVNDALGFAHTLQNHMKRVADIKNKRLQK